jgi:CheY-like chemotaxis protein
MRILVAEDIEDTRCLMKLLLQKRGHTVLEADNGESAVECALREQPDLILMDLSMPVMDGLAATRSIRRRETGRIPIVAVSAYLADPAWRERALRCGCDYCCTKPLDFEALDDLLAVGAKPH